MKIDFKYYEFSFGLIEGITNNLRELLYDDDYTFSRTEHEPFFFTKNIRLKILKLELYQLNYKFISSVFKKFQEVENIHCIL